MDLAYKIAKHHLENAQSCPSSHCDERPDDEDISLLVIHNISLPPGEFGGRAVEDFFCGKLEVAAHPFFESISQLRVSSHLFIKRDGHIVQFVPFNRRAWHAGVSSFQGRSACNDFSIGIELEGTDDQAYTESQYLQLAAVTKSLMRRYPMITSERIVGHCDIAPDRKTDPGPSFDWSHYRHLLTH